MRKTGMKGVIIIGVLMLTPALTNAQGNAQKGKTLFDQNCAMCHGATGKGDGAAAAALNPKPRNLADKAYVSKLKDQDLANIIKNGGAAAGKSPLMPPFGGALKDGDITDVIAYIRSLAM
jgi:mono/diheme cytochrome c family protein